MKILYDGKIYSHQSRGGINRYFGNIIERLPGDFDPTLTLAGPKNGTYPSHQNLHTVRYPNLRPGFIFSKLEPVYFSIRERCNRFDLIHPTYYGLLSKNDLGRCRCPVVLTVWDTIPELYPEQLDPDGSHRKQKAMAINAATRIICISHNTKKDVVERYGVDPDKITVTHLASELTEEMAFGMETVPVRPYLLYVGSRAGYKNFTGVLKSLVQVAAAQPDLILAVAGPMFTAAEEKMIGEMKLRERINNYGEVTDRHLAKLYRNSRALIYPSFYEGFGIPLLEAMACGTAVIASKWSSIPEVVQDCGILFDPRFPGEMTEAILFIHNNQGARQELIDKGRVRAKQFSWEATTQKTLGVYLSVV